MALPDDEGALDDAERLQELKRQLRGFAELNDRAGYLKWLNGQPGFSLVSPRALWRAGQAWKAARAEIQARRPHPAKPAAVRKGKV
jgi:hypothetical protein